MATSNFRFWVSALLTCCLIFAHVAQAQSAFTDYTMPDSGQVTIPAEGGLTFQMKVNGQGPFATVFDIGAVNVISANFATQLGLKMNDNSIDFGAIGGGVKVHTTKIDTQDWGPYRPQSDLLRP
ncbi:aspartyl protease family protein [Granulicella sp. dw_53]|uniref:aspartyl protease family protein n=1 Tax=Granulicella sp. dw_53 TaxID=2719792 RepID=UPI001BD3F5F6|nr:aspartyl protease family protein [Granulicella sp. dw_53]